MTGPGVPPLVTLHLWRVTPRQVPAALLRAAADHRALRHVAGLRFAKVLGTGDGRTFAVRDATPTRWALLAAWDSPDQARRFATVSRTALAWARLAVESWQAELTPLASRGRWSRREPFGTPSPRPYDGPVAAVTRARLVPRKARAFRRAVPPVSADLHRVDGLRLAVGIGEAPVGLQGTFSLWESAAALRTFAHERQPHRDVVRRTAEEGWYAEELFARFAVVGTRGTVDGVDPLA